MPLATEVARVCGAMLNRRNESILAADFTIPEIVRDINAYVKRTRREILKKLRAQKCRSQ